MTDDDSSGEKNGRRTFMIKLAMAIGALEGIFIAIPALGALLAPFFRKIPSIWRDVGAVDDFTVGNTVLVSFQDSSPLPWSGITAQTASWLRRVSVAEFIAFSVNCSHLGCPVRWIPDGKIFLCPCHGGVYNEDGSYEAGPPPHGLSRYPVRVQNGRVQILTSPIPITNI
jgi:menaquinol-cytochrome c reductase iron-sulfur subunit